MKSQVFIRTSATEIRAGQLTMLSSYAALLQSGHTPKLLIVIITFLLNNFNIAVFPDTLSGYATLHIMQVIPKEGGLQIPVCGKYKFYQF